MDRPWEEVDWACISQGSHKIGQQLPLRYSLPGTHISKAETQGVSASRVRVAHLQKQECLPLTSLWGESEEVGNIVFRWRHSRWPMFFYEELVGLESSESWLLGRTLACRVGVALYEIAMRHLEYVARLRSWLSQMRQIRQMTHDLPP